jgi:DNA-binding GntR family transcriptional regulator
MRQDATFHLLLQEAAGDEVLADHLGLLRRQAVLFWGQTTDGKASLHPVIHDFENVFHAVRKKDIQQCVRTLHDHVLAHVDRVQSYLKPSERLLTSFSRVSV